MSRAEDGQHLIGDGWRRRCKPRFCRFLLCALFRLLLFNHRRRWNGQTRPTVGRNRNRFLATQVRSRDTPHRLFELLRRATGDNLTTLVPRARSEIKNLVTIGNHFAVVFNHNQRVAQVAKFVQRPKQPQVVARMQTDCRLVEHIEHPAQTTPQLAGQPNSLGLTIAERRRSASQRKVIEPHIVEELHPVLNFAS